MTSSQMPPRDVLEARLGRFVKQFELALDAHEVPPDAGVPREWLNLLRAQHETDRPQAPASWASFAEELPTGRRYLRDALRGVGVLLTPNAPPALLYVHTYDSGARPSFYIGRPPVSVEQLPPKVAAVWNRLPAKLRTFYTSVHNGWTELSSNAGGPAEVTRLSFLSDDEWDISAEGIRGLPFRMEDVLTVFSNAAGDYLGVDTSRADWDGSANGVIFYHEEPTAPEVDLDFWAVLDAWFGIFVERADGFRPLVPG